MPTLALTIGNIIKWFSDNWEGLMKGGGQILDAGKSYLGLDFLDELDDNNRELQAYRKALVNTLNTIKKGYVTYAQQTHTDIPTNSTELMENALTEAQNNQSEFSKFLNGYAPFSTAKRIVQTRYNALVKATDVASKALSAANEANRQIEEKNSAAARDVAVANEKARVAAETANKAVDDKVNQVNSIIDSIDNLSSFSAYTKAQSEPWKQMKQDVVQEAEAIVGPVETKVKANENKSE